MKSPYRLALGCCMVGWMLAGGLPAHAQGTGAQTTNPANQLKEIQIMAQVLEDALQSQRITDLDQAEGASGGGYGVSPAEPYVFDPNGIGINPGAAPWASPFRARQKKISTQYLPTVGVIFKFGVDFPLIEPPKPAVKETPAPAPAADDLWQKHSQAAAAQAENPYNNWAGAYKLARTKIKTSTPYDAARVSALRKSLLATIARYGYKMEHLADDERILVHVISTSDSSQKATSISGLGDGVKILNLARGGPGQDGAWTGTFGGRDGGTFVMDGLTMNEFSAGASSTDHLLLSFRKRDLKKELTTAQLGEDHVVECRYRIEDDQDSPGSAYRAFFGRALMDQQRALDMQNQALEFHQEAKNQERRNLMAELKRLEEQIQSIPSTDVEQRNALEMQKQSLENALQSFPTDAPPAQTVPPVPR